MQYITDPKYRMEKAPKGWMDITNQMPPNMIIGGQIFVSKKGLRVIRGVEQFENDHWLHVSFSRENRIPDHKDTLEVKKFFIGKDKKAIQIYPNEKEYVNIHPFTLHLWCNLYRDLLPDFRRTEPMTGRRGI